VASPYNWIISVLQWYQTVLCPRQRETARAVGSRQSHDEINTTLILFSDEAWFHLSDVWTHRITGTDLQKITAVIHEERSHDVKIGIWCAISATRNKGPIFQARSQNCKKRLLASSCLSVRRSSVRMEQLGSHWTDFHEIWYLSIFRKPVQKIQYQYKFMIISRRILLRMKIV
jgi:hypothetical protein